MGEQYRLKRSLLVREAPSKNMLQVGVFPPFAYTIDAPPHFLAELLDHWSAPRSLVEIREWACAHFSTIDPALLAQSIIEIIAVGLVEPVGVTDSRFDRHLLYFELCGVPQSFYQEKLKHASIGIIGTGGLGSTAAMLLTAAGVGHLTISDGDRVEESNLTRSVLFDESDLGAPKVERAKIKLTARSSCLCVTAVEKAIDGPGFVHDHFNECDILLVSADQPADITEWVNEAAQNLGIPYLRAGYMETQGLVGPLVVPGKSPCFNCNVLNDEEPGHKWRMLNKEYQAPSYGPLNMLVASVAVNDVLRHLLGLTPASRETLLIIDSQTYQVRRKVISRNDNCRCWRGRITQGTKDKQQSENLASHYVEFRNSSSMNAMFLDANVLRLVPRNGNVLRILDLGCGIGSLSIPLAKEGHHVTAIDISQSMIDKFRRDLPENLASKISLQCGDAMHVSVQDRQDCVLLNLIIDHIIDPTPLLKKVYSWLQDDGIAIVTVPHPFKDAGTWDKSPSDEGWIYNTLMVDNYFTEGPIDKSREDSTGRVVLKGVRTQKRTLQTYFQMLVESGFTVNSLHEPTPSPENGLFDNDAHFAKASRIPYFLVFVCSRRP